MLLFCDGFDSYTGTGDLIKKWGANQSPTYLTFSANEGRWGGGCFKVNNVSGYLVGPQVPLAINPVNARIRVAFWYKKSVILDNGYQPIFQLTGPNSTGLWRPLTLHPSGQLATQSYSWSPPILQMSAVAVNDNQWHWIEVDSLLGGAGVGRNIVYLDGTKVIDYSGATQDGTGLPTVFDTFGLSGTWSGGTNNVAWVDDLMIWNDQGTAFNTFPIGPQRIQTVRPSSDSAVQFTRNTGAANYSAVADTSSDDDTTYVESSVSGNMDLYLHGQLAAGTASVSAIVLNTRAKNPDLGEASLVPKIQSGSTTASGTTVQLAQAYRLYQQPFYTDPDTGGTWTPSATNASKIGFGVP